MINFTLVATWIGKTGNKRYEILRSMVMSGEYRIYLDGVYLEDPRGVDVSKYSYRIDKEHKIIMFTTERSFYFFNM